MLSLHPWWRGPGGLRGITSSSPSLMQLPEQRRRHVSCKNTKAASALFLMQNVLSVHMKGENPLKWKIGEMCTAAANSLALHKKVKTACQFQSYLFNLHKSQSVRTTCLRFKSFTSVFLGQRRFGELRRFMRRFLDINTDQERIRHQHPYALSVLPI